MAGYSLPGARERQTCTIKEVTFFDDFERRQVTRSRARDSETGIDAGGETPAGAFRRLLVYVGRKRRADTWA